MTKTIRKTASLFIAAALLAACGEGENPHVSYADDPSIFGAAAKADGLSLEEGSHEAAGVLRVANELSFSDLDDVVKLDVRAARNIVEHRDANGPFTTLQGLDDIKYVGVTAITRMREYAQGAGWIGTCGDGVINGNELCDGGDDCAADCGLGTAPDPEAVLVHGVAMGSYDALGILAVANEQAKDVLDDAAALDSRAAANIVDARPIPDLKALDGVSYVGARAFGRLLDFARAEGLIPACGDGTVDLGIETCDDGNLLDGDGCDSTCKIDDGGLDLPLVHGVLEGSDDAIELLKVANTAPLSTLDYDVGLDVRAANNIVAARAEGAIPDLVALDAISYVGRSAFEKLLDFALNGDLVVPVCGDGTLDDGEACDDGNAVDGDGCDSLCVVEEPAADAVIFDGDAQCSGENQGATRYTYSVISNPPMANTDAHIELRFNSQSPYSPRSQALELETAPNVWTTVFTTAPAVSGWQTQTTRVSAETLNAAIETMGWLRFRVNPGTYYTACSELSVTYNCPDCFACPAGQEDVGFGCQDIGADYDQTLLDHSRGMCSRSSATLTFLSAPVAASDGRLSLQFLPCDGGRIAVSMNTRNAGWVDIGTASTGMSCGFANGNFDVPEAYLDAARNAAGEIEIRYSISDSCRPGMGCAGHNDPCVRHVNLTYEQ